MSKLHSESKAAQQQVAPPVLVNSTMAMFPVVAGFFAQNLLVYGDIRIGSLILLAFALQNLFLCYFWRRLESRLVKTVTLVLTVACQWVYVASSVAAVYFKWSEGVMVANLAGLFMVSAALILYMIRMGLERSGSAAVFAVLGLTTMAAMIWHGLGDWTMAARALSRVSFNHHSSGSGDSSGHAPSVKNHKSSHGPSGDTHWAYLGETGPEMWGALKDEFKTCSAGTSQSPVDIPKRTNRMRGDIRFEWVPEKGSVVNNGHTIQVNLPGKSKMLVSGQSYVLKQFHFHTPSEHQISGLSYPMEVHFVHSTADGRLAVLGALVEMGAANQEIGKIMPFIPATSDSGAATTSEISFASLLPKDLSVFRYQGSLTTPPCSEGVLWSVLAEPIEFSRDQVTAFRRMFPMNARPVQPMGARAFESSSMPVVAH